MNAMATMVSVFMPAFLPRCHYMYEVGSFFIPSNNNATFMEVSPDGVIKCANNCANCQNRIAFPVGTMPFEIKCPYTPINDKKLLPVQYHPPQYNCCQLLSQMVATKSETLLFASCSLESMVISLLEFSQTMWQSVWSLARELYADASITKPTTLHGETTKIKEELKEYCEKSSTLVAELPVVNGMDANMEQRTSSDNCYKFVDKISSEYVDAAEINQQICELCEESCKLVVKANNLQRRKASEVLLFVCTDSDRSFNKEKPSSIPLAYALKGRSIRISTARKMINVVRDRLKQNGTKILCEAVDGQWSGIVFRDESLRPLTLFELQRDCWLKFAKMSKENLLQFLQDISYVSNDDKQLCSQIDINYFSSHRYGNLEVYIEPYREPEDDRVVRKIYMHSYSGSYQQGATLGRLRTPSRSKRPDLWEMNLGVKHNLLEVLGLVTPNVYKDAPSLASDLADEEEQEDFLLNLRSELVDESDRTPEWSRISIDDSGRPIVTSHDIRLVLLGTEIRIIEDVLLALLCSERAQKWNSYNCTEFYNYALSSTHAIYSSMTNHDIDITINVLRKYES